MTVPARNRFVPPNQSIIAESSLGSSSEARSRRQRRLSSMFSFPSVTVSLFLPFCLPCRAMFSRRSPERVEWAKTEARRATAGVFLGAA